MELSQPASAVCVATTRTSEPQQSCWGAAEEGWRKTMKIVVAALIALAVAIGLVRPAGAFSPDQLLAQHIQDLAQFQAGPSSPPLHTIADASGNEKGAAPDGSWH